MMTTTLGPLDSGEMTSFTVFAMEKSFPHESRLVKTGINTGNDSFKNKIIREKRPSVNQNVRFLKASYSV